MKARHANALEERKKRKIDPEPRNLNGKTGKKLLVRKVLDLEDERLGAGNLNQRRKRRMNRTWRMRKRKRRLRGREGATARLPLELIREDAVEGEVVFGEDVDQIINRIQLP